MAVVDFLSRIGCIDRTLEAKSVRRVGVADRSGQRWGKTSVFMGNVAGLGVAKCHRLRHSNGGTGFELAKWCPNKTLRKMRLKYGAIRTAV